MAQYFEVAKEVAGFLANIATFLGIWFAISTFRQERERARVEREKEKEEAEQEKVEKELVTFNVLSKEYREYLRLCLENLDLSAHDWCPDTTAILTLDQQKRKMIMFEILVATFESAYFMYRNHSNDFKTAQWEGWNQYMRDYCEREDFQNAWKNHLCAEYDTRFMAHMNSIIADVKQGNTH